MQSYMGYLRVFKGLTLHDFAFSPGVSICSPYKQFHCPTCVRLWEEMLSQCWGLSQAVISGTERYTFAVMMNLGWREEGPVGGLIPPGCPTSTAPTSYHCLPPVTE